MKKIAIKMLTTWLGLLILTSSVQAEMATRDEALTVANNWINLIIQEKGSWGDVNTAVVQDIQEFKCGERTIGYFCNVNPVGYIVISLRKELAPVKAYSATCDLDPESEEGLADLIKVKMESILNWVEQLVGPIKSARTLDVQSILEINYRSSWETLGGNVKTLKEGLKSDIVMMDYQGGEPPLLTSSWRQGDPYNERCPTPEQANDAGDGDDAVCSEAHCAVGCTPLAGAQVMRYWAWPPHKDPSTGMYDWANMPDRLTGSSPWAQIEAVAKLCYEVGVAAGAGGKYCEGECDPPCPCGTGVYFADAGGRDLLDAFKDHFRYDTDAENEHRNANTAAEWFELIQDELNDNRPLPYAVKNHVIVCDGWQIVGSQKQYNMNYGWDNARNAWYALDALYLGGKDDEEMLVEIRPDRSEGSVISGHREPWPGAIGRRYFDQDADNCGWGGCKDASYTRYNCQFLPRVTVTCRGATETVEFIGTEALPSRLYSIKGTKVAGVRIYNGSIKLYENGSIRFH